MQEHEYKARDKTVKKMSREGLTEENLHSREAVSICLLYTSPSPRD